MCLDLRFRLVAPQQAEHLQIEGVEKGQAGWPVQPELPPWENVQPVWDLPSDCTENAPQGSSFPRPL